MAVNHSMCLEHEAIINVLKEQARKCAVCTGFAHVHMNECPVVRSERLKICVQNGICTVCVKRHQGNCKNKKVLCGVCRKEFHNADLCPY